MHNIVCVCVRRARLHAIIDWLRSTKCYHTLIFAWTYSVTQSAWKIWSQFFVFLLKRKLFFIFKGKNENNWYSVNLEDESRHKEEPTLRYLGEDSGLSIEWELRFCTPAILLSFGFVDDGSIGSTPISENFQHRIRNSPSRHVIYLPLSSSPTAPPFVPLFSPPRILRSSTLARPLSLSMTSVLSISRSSLGELKPTLTSAHGSHVEDTTVLQTALDP